MPEPTNAMTPEQRAEKREAAVQSLVDKGYTRERAEELIGLIAGALFAPGKPFGRPIPPATCPHCGHQHTPDGCTGDPTPSDLWAGVSVEGCDCAYDFPPAVCSCPDPLRAVDPGCERHGHGLPPTRVTPPGKGEAL